MVWQEFEPALARAVEERKAVMVVVYADWCPKCRALAPLFRDGPLAAASARVVPVLANHDKRPEWLEAKLGDTANYVPRVYFLGPDGKVRRDIVSDNEKFPHFFHPNKPEKLVAAIDRAVAGVTAASTPGAAAPVAARDTPAAGSAGSAPPAVGSANEHPAAAGAQQGVDRDLVAAGLLGVLLAAAGWWVLRSKPAAAGGEGSPPSNAP